MILAPTNKRITRPYDKPSFEHTQRYGLIKGHWGNRNCVGFWPHNEEAGNIVLDLSGNDHHGNITGAIWQPAQFVSTLCYNPGDYVNMGILPALSSQSEVTISMWVKRRLSNTYVVMGVFTASATNIVIDVWQDGRIYFSVSNGGSQTYGYVTASGNAWQHVAGVFNGNLIGNANRLKLYVNAIQQTLTFAGTIPATTGNLTSDFRLGKDNNPNSDGLIDNVIVFNRDLSHEIDSLYNEPFCMVQKKTALVYFFVPTGVGEDYFRTVNDSVGILDAMGRTQVQSRTIDDCIGTPDAMGRTQVQSRSVADDLGITDALWKAETRIFADALGITDVVTRSQALARTIADSIGIGDDVNRLMTYARTLAEALGITDAITTLKDFPRTVSDGVGITDSVTATVTYARVVAEAMGITDAVTRTQVQLRTIADDLGLTDAMTPGQLIIFAEAMGMTDAMTRTQVQVRTVADALGITDDLTRIAAYVFNQADDIGIADAMIRVAVALRTVSDDIGMTDTVSTILPGLVKAAWAFMIIRQTHN